MAAAATRASANTELFVGTFGAGVSLYRVEASPGRLQRFDTAGPNGGVLRYEQRAVAVEEPLPAARPVGENGASDPLAASPTPAEVRVAQAVAREAQRIEDLPEGRFQRVLVEEGSGEVVAPEDVRHGVRLEDGRFVDCTDQIAAIEERTRLERMDVVVCIDSTRVPRTRVTGAFYVAPQSAQDAPALRVLYEALRRRREAAIVKYTVRSRQRLGAIIPHARAHVLMLLTLMWAEDIREAPVRAMSIQAADVTEGQVAMMSELLGALHGSVEDVDALRDDAIALREELRARAMSGEMFPMVVDSLPPAPVSAGDMSESLERALEEAGAR